MKTITEVLEVVTEVVTEVSEVMSKVKSFRFSTEFRISLPEVSFLD
jgi:hypothetical protein